MTEIESPFDYLVKLPEYQPTGADISIKGDGRGPEYFLNGPHNGTLMRPERRRVGGFRTVVLKGVGTSGWNACLDTLLHESARLVLPKSTNRLRRHSRPWEDLLRIQKRRGITKKPSMETVEDFEEHEFRSGQGHTDKFSPDGNYELTHIDRPPWSTFPLPRSVISVLEPYSSEHFYSGA